MNKEKKDLEAKMNGIFDNNDLDVIIMPVFPGPSFKAVNSQKYTNANTYCSIWNLVEFPAGVIPVTDVLKEESENPKYEDSYNDGMTAAIRDDLADSQGMPIGI